jgi:Response regulator containing a CheY-like receiver domain and an HTH DNA-binding domain
MKILLADDHPLFREGVKHVLMLLGDEVKIVDAHDYPTLFAEAAANPDLDLVLADLYMPGMGGHEGVAEFRNQFPDTPLVIMTASESRADARRALASGALGYVLKSSPSQEMLDALIRVLDGGIYVPPILVGDEQPDDPFSLMPLSNQGIRLTHRQLEVLKLLLQGKPNKIIARELDLSEGTVKIHVAAIFKALGVSNRTEAAVAAQRFGLNLAGA